MSRTIIVRDHVIRRLRSVRFGVWQDEPNYIIEKHVKELIAQGVRVGAQLNPGVAYEVVLPNGVTAYLMGEQLPEYTVIVTALTLDQYIGNLRAAGICDPTKAPTRHKFSRRTRRSAERKLKQKKPWKFDRD